jgi:integrase
MSQTLAGILTAARTSLTMRTTAPPFEAEKWNRPADFLLTSAPYAFAQETNSMKAFKVKRNQQDYYRVDLAPRLFLDGKRRSVMAKTRREAIEKAEALIAKRKKGLNTDRAKATVGEFLTRFLDYYRTEGGVALRTWQDYRYHIENNIVPAIGTLPLGELKPLQVDEWIRGLRERGLGDRTIEYAQSVLRRALQFAVEWEIIERSPAGARFRAAKRKRTVKPGGKKIRFLDPDETRRFLEATKGGAHEALYALTITTGMRPEEVYGLRWRDVDLDHRKLTVNQVVAKTRRKKGDTCARLEFGAPKTDKSRRTLDFPLFVAELLADHRAEVHELRRFAGETWRDHGLVFPSQVGTPLDERNVLRRFQKICESIGLPRLRLYDLRHTHASLLIHEGVHPKRIS